MEIASPGNQHCASCIGTLSFAIHVFWYHSYGVFGGCVTKKTETWAFWLHWSCAWTTCTCKINHFLRLLSVPICYSDWVEVSLLKWRPKNTILCQKPEESLSMAYVFVIWFYWCSRLSIKKVKVAHTRLPSVEFRSWSWFLAVGLRVTWVINPAVGCHYFPTGLQLPSQPLRGLPPISLLGEHRHDACVPDSVAAAIWTQALLRLSPAR